MIKNNIKRYLLFILVLTLFSISVSGGSSDFSIESQQSYAVMKINNSIQDHTGLRYEVLNNGYYKVTDKKGEERYFGFGITGQYNSNPFTRTLENYTWSYEINEYNYTNSSIIEYYNITATNNDNSWKINFLFYTDGRDMKILHTLTNVYPLSITNTKMWYIMTIKDSDSIKYNGIEYANQTVSLTNNLTDKLSNVEFNTDFNFDYVDLIENNFTISNFYLGNGSIIGYSNYNIMALGVTKNAGVFPSGTTIILDPTITESEFTINSTIILNQSEVFGGGTIIEQDAVVQLHFNGDARDSSVDRNHGTLVGNTFFNSSGKFGSAADFDGAGDYITLPNSDSWKFGTSGFSIGFWTYIPSGAGWGGGLDNWVSYRHPSSAGDNTISIFQSGTDEIGFTFKATDGTFDTVTTTAIQRDTWHYVVAVRDGDSIHIYLDGNLTDSGSGFSGKSARSYSYPLYIGVNGYLPGTYSLDGLMDEVQIYSRALTEAEIIVHNNSASAPHNAHRYLNATTEIVREFRNYDYDGNTTGQVAYWKLDDDLIDSVGGYNGTFGGGLTACNIAGVGGYGDSCDFDGIDDVIDLPVINGSLNSFSFWFNPDNTITSTANPEGMFAASSSTLSEGGIYLGSLTGSIANEMVLLIDDEGSNDLFWWDTSTITQFDAGTWYHLSFNWNSTSSNYVLYINGVNKGNGMKLRTPIQLTNIDWFMGVISSNYFDGKIDEVVVYNRSLSDDEVFDNYQFDVVANGYLHSLDIFDWYTLDQVLKCSFDTSSPTQCGESGFENDGTVTGAIFNSSGKYGGAYQFDGSSGVISAGNILPFTNQDFSIEAWINNEDFASTTGGAEQRVIAKRVDNSNDYQLIAGSNSEYIFSRHKGGTEYAVRTGVSSMTANTWYHVVATFDDSTNTANIYVDGVFYNTSLTGLGVGASGTNLNIGERSDGNGNFKGLVDEVNIYDRVLSVAEILARNNSAIPYRGVNTTNMTVDIYITPTARLVSNETGLVGWWNMTNQSGEVIDKSGQSNNGTINGNPVDRTGKGCYPSIASCIEFDGSDDYITVSQDSSINFGDIDFTMAAWIKPSATGIIIGKDDDGNAGYQMRLTSEGVIRVRVWDGTGTGGDYIGQVSSDSLFNFNEWVYVVGYHSATNNEVGISINGGAFKTSATTGAAGGGTSNLNIGAGIGGSPVFEVPFDGTIDDVAIHNRTLPASEVLDNYLHDNRSARVFVETVNGADNISLDGTVPGRFYNFVIHHTSTDKDYSPILTGFSSTFENFSKYISSITINITSVIGLNSSGGAVANFSTQFLEEIETVRVNATITSIGGNISETYLNFTADGTNGCAVGNLQDEQCYNYDNDTFRWIQFINGTNTSTFDALNFAAGDLVIETFSLSADKLSANVSFLIEEHYNPNVIKHYSARYNFSDAKFQSGSNQRIHKSNLIWIHIHEENLPLDADQYKLDLRVNFTTGADLPLQPLEAWMCNENHTSGTPESSSNCALVATKLPGELQDDGTKFRSIFTKSLIDQLGILDHIILTSDIISNNRYYSLKTYKANAAGYTTHWNYSSNNGATWTNLGDGYESEVNINFFYDGVDPTTLVLRFWANNTDGVSGFNEFNNTWSIDATQNYPPIVDITSPDINDTIVPRDGVNITFTHDDPNENDTHVLQLLLFQDGVFVKNISGNIGEGQNSFLWTDATIIDGFYDIFLNVTENNTVDNFTVNDSVNVNINGLPIAILVSPANNTFSTNFTQNYTINATDFNDFRFAYLFVYNSSGNIVNKTIITDTADSSNISVGENHQGDWFNTTVLDGDYMTVGEISDTPGYTFFLNYTFMEENDENCNFVLFGKYAGAPADDVFYYAFNHTASNWSVLRQLDDSGSDIWYNTTVNDCSDFIGSDGVIQTMINHTSTGSDPHEFNLDYAAIITQSYTGRINLTGRSEIISGTLATLSEGVFTWNYKAYDNILQTSWASNNFTITLDQSGPVINITYPIEGQIFNTSYNYTIEINFTVNDILNGVDTCWYSLNGGINITISSCNNFTVVSPNGANNIVIYANDSAGNIGNSNRNYIIDIEGQWLIDVINVPATGTTSIPFIVNSTADIFDGVGIASNISWTHDAGGLCIASAAETDNYGNLANESQESFGVEYTCSAAGSYEFTVEWCTAHNCTNASQSISIAASTIDELLFCLRDGDCAGWWVEKIINMLELLVLLNSPHHTVENSNMFFVDPINGLDTNDGVSSSRPFKTVNKALIAIPSNSHTAIRLMSSGVATETVFTECIDINKNYIFIYGDGRDAIWRPSGNCTPITISGIGVGISGFQIDLQDRDDNGIEITGDFAWVKDVWFGNGNGSTGILINGSEHSIIMNNFFNDLGSGSTSIHITSHAGDNSNYNEIKDNTMFHTFNDGILISGSNTAHTVIKNNEIVHGQNGIRITDGAKKTSVHGNTFTLITNEINTTGQGTGNEYENNEQWAKENTLNAVNITINNNVDNVSNEVWDYESGKYINGETP